MCQAYWPCIRCDRDYQEICPEGWIHANSGLRCSPPPNYNGPCRGIKDFTGYNVEMFQRWSSQCGAFWRCRVDSVQDVYPVQSMYPISKDATLLRIARGLQ